MKNLLREPNSETGGNTPAKVESVAPPAVAPITTQGSPSVPVSPEPAMPESLKGKTFDIEGEDFNNSPTKVSKEFETVAKDIKPKKDETKQDDTTKTENNENAGKSKFSAKFPTKEEKKEEPATKEQLESLATKTKDSTKLPERDFSIFPEEAKGILKDTSRAAFDYITKTFKELTDVKAAKEVAEKEVKTIRDGGFPNQWHQHPEAWRLHPEAQKAVQKIEMLDVEENFWKEQLSNISNGKKFRLLKGWDKSGQLVVGDEIEPTEDAKNEIFLRLGRYQAAKNNEAIRINGFAQSFSAKANQFVQGVEKIIDTEWPWHKDEKHEGQKFVKEFKEQLPPEVADQLGFKVAALLYASLRGTEALLDEEKGKQRVEKIKEDTVKIAEPSLRSPSISGENKPRIGGNGSYAPPATFDLSGL